MEIWFVRHGESTWNRERRFQGARDAPLSDLGRAQAGALGTTLAGAGLTAIYASPQRRASETAARCADGLGLSPTLDENLREIGLGAWEGFPVEVVIAEYGDHYWRWLETPADHPPPGGEPVAQLRARVGAAVRTMQARHPDGRVLAVSHGGAIASFLAGMLELGDNAIWRLRLANASVTRVDWPAGRLLSLGDTRHLAGLGASGGGA